MVVFGSRELKVQSVLLASDEFNSQSVGVAPDQFKSHSVGFEPERLKSQFKYLNFGVVRVLLLTALIFLCQTPVLSQGEETLETAGPGGQIAYKYYMQGQQLEAAGDLANAIEAYKNAEQHAPRVKEIHHALAKLFARTGANELALSEFRNCINIDGNFVEARNNYGSFLKRTGSVSEAESTFRQCIQINPKFPYAYHNLGKILHDRGDLDGAIQNFEHATNLKPDFAEGQEALGMAIFERASQGDLKAAAGKLVIASRLVPQNPKIHYHLGQIYASESNLDAAETEFRKALMCDPKFSAAHFELGKLRYYRGDLDRALMELKAAQTISPSYTMGQDYPTLDPIKLKTLQAQSYEHMGDLIHALETYEQLVAMRKSDVLYASHIKDLQKQIKQEIAAKKKKQQLPYDPEEVDAFIAKGIDQYEDGDLDAARAAFERGLELNAQSFRCTQNLAFVKEQQGDLNGALATAQRAIELNPTYDGALYNLAYLLEKGSLPDEAAKTYERFRALANAYPYDSQHIAEIQQNIIREKKKEEFIRKRGY